MQKYYLGIDIGSTTVKCILVSDQNNNIILWKKYKRHETKQAETCLQLIKECYQDFPELESTNKPRVYITGSGSDNLKKPLNGLFVQEVNAVSMAVLKLHPKAGSVVELGGQDAKMIFYKENKNTGDKRIITSMNDKCASGTGATIDKCCLKVGLNNKDISKINYNPDKLHHVAAKCGVFAETDIVNLVKSSVPSDEIINSLADAIVMQNLSVLTRGNTLVDEVILLGGPNAYLPVLQQCWRHRIPEMWQERDYKYNKSIKIEDLIIVPPDAEYYAALGAVLFGQAEQQHTVLHDLTNLEQYINSDRADKLANNSNKGLYNQGLSLTEFNQKYPEFVFKPKKFKKNTLIHAALGIDGGSTTTKAVLLDHKNEVIFKGYLISKGNPIEDTQKLLLEIKQWASNQDCKINIKCAGVTGYAGDVLTKAMNCDANIVETVAHAMSAKKFCGDDVDIICDIGGQDIKVIFLHNGEIKRFKLSNQCSAGNGMLLQAMADQFGVKMTDFADNAFRAKLSPKFSYGCAVFLDSDRVTFQKEGYTRDELFAGLALVLPKNIWQYVVQESKLDAHGKVFVLQGGTQRNRAALKAQIDYILNRVPDADIRLHPFCGEGGAIGAALEAQRLLSRTGKSTFIGLEPALKLQYSTRTDEQTRCTFCKNHCSRTFIDIKIQTKSEIKTEETARYIAGFSCEKGTVESKEEVKKINKHRLQLKNLYPNLVDTEADLLFRFNKDIYEIIDNKNNIDSNFIKIFKNNIFNKIKSIYTNNIRTKQDIINTRKNYRVGIPRVLNIYTIAPFLRGYLYYLGLDHRNIIFSDETNDILWAEGGKYGSIDPCFPSKVALAHVHQLLTAKQERNKLNSIWYPVITHIPNFLEYTMDDTTCPIVAGSPCVAKSAFNKEKDWFKNSGTDYINEAMNFKNINLLKDQLYNTWKDILFLTRKENNQAVEYGLKTYNNFNKSCENRGLKLLDYAELNNKIALLMLARPYHSDPGLNHEIMTEFQTLGYPVLSIRSIPKDIEFLNKYFAKDLNNNYIKSVFDINDVWPENYSVNSAQKVWAAKFAARHPNIAVVDLSSFKCGHDAPTYGIIDNIMSTSQTPFFAFHDIDANKPSGSIAIRVKTFAYALQRYEEQLQDINKSDLNYDTIYTTTRA